MPPDPGPTRHWSDTVSPADRVDPVQHEADSGARVGVQRPPGGLRAPGATPVEIGTASVKAPGLDAGRLSNNVKCCYRQRAPGVK